MEKKEAFLRFAGQGTQTRIAQERRIFAEAIHRKEC